MTVRPASSWLVISADIGDSLSIATRSRDCYEHRSSPLECDLAQVDPIASRCLRLEPRAGEATDERPITGTRLVSGI
jgi:hypothetical protein